MINRVLVSALGIALFATPQPADGTPTFPMVFVGQMCEVNTLPNCGDGYTPGDLRLELSADGTGTLELDFGIPTIDNVRWTYDSLSDPQLELVRDSRPNDYTWANRVGSQCLRGMIGFGEWAACL